MQFSLRLLESESAIKQMVLDSIKDHLQTAFYKARMVLAKTIPVEIYKAIVSEPEYQSLLSGRLRYEFGIPEAAQKVNDIVNIWANNVIVNVTPITLSGSGLKGGFSIGMIQSNYEDVLTSDSALVFDGLSKAVLPWLEWLLLYGNKIIVKNYTVQVGPNPYSRTGLAIMKPSKENWRVPPEFAGTQNNNWVTRALDKLDENRIPIMIQTEIEKNI